MGETPVITDPDDPAFNPEEFRFEHYSEDKGNQWDLPAALLKIFPPGTPHSYIDKILVDQAGMKTALGRSGDRYDYMRTLTGLGGWLVHVFYDGNDRSRVFYLGGNRLYGEWKEIDKNNADNSTPGSNTKRAYELLEQTMRPIRKKYLGDPEGLIYKARPKTAN
jgi:hypothetical protein